MTSILKDNKGNTYRIHTAFKPASIVLTTNGIPKPILPEDMQDAKSYCELQEKGNGRREKGLIDIRLQVTNR